MRLTDQRLLGGKILPAGYTLQRVVDKNGELRSCIRDNKSMDAENEVRAVPTRDEDQMLRDWLSHDCPRMEELREETSFNANADAPYVKVYNETSFFRDISEGQASRLRFNIALKHSLSTGLVARGKSYTLSELWAAAECRSVNDETHLEQLLRLADETIAPPFSVSIRKEAGGTFCFE